MKVITIGNEKGGVGKTTLSGTLAAGLAREGFRVLAIDADGQGQLSRFLGVQKDNSFYRWLIDKAKAQDVIKAVPQAWHQGSGILGVIASDETTSGIANSLGNGSADILRRLKELEDYFDLAVWDTGPTPSLLHGAIFQSTNYMLHPTLCEQWAYDGLSEAVGRVDAINEWFGNIGATQRIKVLGVQPVRYRDQLILHQEIYGLMQADERFGSRVWEPITERVAWGEAAAYSVPVVLYDKGKAAAEANAFVGRVLAALKEDV